HEHLIINVGQHENSALRSGKRQSDAGPDGAILLRYAVKTEEPDLHTRQVFGVFNGRYLGQICACQRLRAYVLEQPGSSKSVADHDVTPRYAHSASNSVR